MSERLSRVLVVAMVVCLGAPSVFGQSFTGQIVGTVKDSTGAVLPGALIAITHLQTNQQLAVTANEHGRYVSVPLDVGEYRVEGTLSGFKRSAKSGITVRIQDTVVVDLVLEVGSLSEEVEVSGDVAQLETTSSSLGKVVDNRRIRDLPLNTRNVFALVFLTPGLAGTWASTTADSTTP